MPDLCLPSAPPQEAFRDQARALLEKHGIIAPGSKKGKKAAAAGSDEELSGSESGSEASEDGSELGSDEFEGGSSDEEAAGGSGSGGSDAEAGSQEEEAAGSSGGEEDEQDAEEEDHPTKRQRQQQQQERQQSQQGASTSGRTAAAAGGGGKALEGPLDLPFTIPVPESYEEFAALVGGRPAEQLRLAVQRIQAFNAAALATEHKRKLQVRRRCGCRAVLLSVVLW